MPPRSTTLAPRDLGGSSGWNDFFWIVVVIAVLTLLLILCLGARRRNRINTRTTARTPLSRGSSRRLQIFNCNRLPPRRDHLAAVQANHRLWRNMQAGPFSHHARSETGSLRPPRTSGSTGPGMSRDDLHQEDVPPPYVPAEPERTLDRGPSMRAARELVRGSWGRDRHRREEENEDLRRFFRGVDDNNLDGAGLIHKPPGYEER